MTNVTISRELLERIIEEHAPGYHDCIDLLGYECEWCELRAQLAAPVQGVNTQLLEALEKTAAWIEQLPVPTVGAAGQLVKIDKTIAAARKEGGKV